MPSFSHRDDSDYTRYYGKCSKCENNETENFLLSYKETITDALFRYLNDAKGIENTEILSVERDEIIKKVNLLLRKLYQ